MPATTTIPQPAAQDQAATVPARRGYVCANPLCGSVASYPGTCCGQPMVSQ
jgi:hypothetical protein